MSVSETVRFSRAALAVFTLLAALAGSSLAIAADAPPTEPPAVSPPAVSTPAAAPSGAPTHALTPEDAGAWLDGFMPNALRQADIAGAVV